MSDFFVGKDKKPFFDGGERFGISVPMKGELPDDSFWHEYYFTREELEAFICQAAIALAGNPCAEQPHPGTWETYDGPSSCHCRECQAWGYAAMSLREHQEGREHREMAQALRDGSWDGSGDPTVWRKRSKKR